MRVLKRRPYKIFCTNIHYLRGNLRYWSSEIAGGGDRVSFATNFYSMVIDEFILHFLIFSRNMRPKKGTTAE